MEKTLFSTPELAQWLGVFHTTVRRWIEGGRIKGIRVGRNYKIPADEVVKILEGHGIPLPETVRKYKSIRQKTNKPTGQYGDCQGSILRKLLIVEDLEEPAFVCRKASILGANQAFAELVGYSQTDLIGINVSDIIGEGADGLSDYTRRQTEMPQITPDAFITRLKSVRNGSREVHIKVGPLDGLKDVYLLVVKKLG